MSLQAIRRKAIDRKHDAEIALKIGRVFIPLTFLIVLFSLVFFPYKFFTTGDYLALVPVVVNPGLLAFQLFMRKEDKESLKQAELVIRLIDQEIWADGIYSSWTKVNAPEEESG